MEEKAFTFRRHGIVSVGDIVMEPYTVIPALPEHIPFLAAVEQAAASVFPPGSIPDAIRADTVPVSLLGEAVSAGRLWVALDAARHVIGFALLLVDGGVALLGEVDVAPEHAGKGLGRELITRVAHRAGELGHDALYLTTFSNVPWNMPFYARIGFSLLPEAEAPPLLREALREERARGMENRVAMRRALPGGTAPGESR